MIKYVSNSFIDRRKYDHCVRMDKLGLVYGYSWYLDEVCHHWDCLVLNDYDAVWPLPFRVKLGVKYFYRPFGVQQLGVFSKNDLAEEQYQGFVDQLKANCSYAEVYLNEGQLQFIGPIKRVLLSDNVNLTLNLNRTFREIYHSYSKHTQRNITRASKHGLQIFERDDPERILDLFRSNRGGDLKLSKAFYRNMAKAMYRTLHKGLGKVWTVYDERNSLCAGIFVVETEKRHTLLFSASSPEGKDLRAMYHLINEYLIYSSGSDKVFDFEGSNSDGLRRFYEGFGAGLNPYKSLAYNALPWPLNYLKKGG